MKNIIKPTFLVNKNTCCRNIERMIRKADANHLKFRPHFKTHQSVAVGEWFRDYGVREITVSSVSMARYFADAGWKDITIAFPVNILEINDINTLASEVNMNLLVENEISMSFLNKHMAACAGIFIEIDTGHHRSGVDVTEIRRIDRMLEFLKKSRQLAFRGFLSHSGQTYSALSVEEIHVRHADVLMKMRTLKHHYGAAWPDLKISLGDTPACSVCGNWDGIDEIRPGNFVFYDLMQLLLGVCLPDDIAAKVLCPVVSVNLLRSEAVIYGGAVHLSKEFHVGYNGKNTYGAVVLEDPDSSQPQISRDTYLAGLSQEHGIVRGTPDEIKSLHSGDLLEIIPVHSCLAADLAGYYLTTEGERIEKINKSEY